MLLTTERLGIIIPGESFKFLCWEIQRRTPGMPRNQEAPIVGNEYAVYITNTIAHLDLFEQVHEGMHPEPLPEGDDIEHELYDAGRIKRETTGEIILFDHSSGMELGDDPVKRAIVGRYVQDNIAGSGTTVLWEVRSKKR